MGCCPVAAAFTRGRRIRLSRSSICWRCWPWACWWANWANGRLAWPPWPCCQDCWQGPCRKPSLRSAAARRFLGLALIFGVTLAAVPPIPAGVFIAVSALAGGLVGADTDVLAAGDAWLTTRALAATGLMIGAQIIMLNAAALSRIMVQRGWGIVPRVAGSWIGAIAVLLLTLAVTGVTGAPSGAMP